MPPRFAASQTQRTVLHPRLAPDPCPWPSPVPQQEYNDDEDGPIKNDNDDNNNNDDDQQANEVSYTFVVTADTQFGMTTDNAHWQDEMAYSRQAVRQINAMEPRPCFCCVCGDLVHMTAEIYAALPEEEDVDRDNGNDENTAQQQENETRKNRRLRRQECDAIQDRQNQDFQTIWSQLHEDIALVCLCGNHDVGNRPTRRSVARFRRAFGDDYVAFWVQPSSRRGAYHIVLNTSLFSDPSGAPDLFQQQYAWLEERLQYARQQQASHIFVFGHRPWFLYHDDEDADTLRQTSSPLDALVGQGAGASIDDAYFVIPLAMRQQVLSLFREYNVTAAFAGHFHQNMVSKTSFGMPMIVTSSLSVVLQSSGIPPEFQEPKNTRGMRVVTVKTTAGSFDHSFIPLSS